MVAMIGEYRRVSWQNTSEKESHLKILQKAVTESNIDLDWLEWKYGSNPLLSKWDLPENLSYGFVEEGEIKGIVNYIPYHYTDGYTSLKGVKLTNIYVEESVRGKGVFSKLLRVAESNLVSFGFDFVFVYPNFSSYPGLIRDNYKDLGVIDTSFYFNAPLSVFINKLTKLYMPPAKFKLKHGFVKRRMVDNDCVNYPIEKYRLPKLTHRWRNKAIKGKYYNQPDQGFLHWRYATKPESNYEYVSCSDNTYLIYRVFERNKMVELYIADIVAYGKEELFELLYCLGAKLSERKIHLIRTIVYTDRQLLKNLNQAGFYQRSSTLLKRLIPQRKLLVKSLSGKESFTSIHQFKLRDCDQDKE